MAGTTEIISFFAIIGIVRFRNVIAARRSETPAPIGYTFRSVLLIGGCLLLVSSDLEEEYFN